MKERLSKLLSAARPHLLRATYLLFCMSFTLPFLDVRGCTTKKMTYYYGYQLIGLPSGFLYLVPIAIFIGYFILSFMRKNMSQSLRAFAVNWRAMTAAFSGIIIVFVPMYQFLFDTVFIRIGQVLAFASAGIVFLDGIAESIYSYVQLRRCRTCDASENDHYSRRMMKYHTIVIIISLVLVPLYSITLRNDKAADIMFFLLLSLPFVLSQCIVLEAVRRGEAWPRRWAVVVGVLLAIVIVFIGIDFFSSRK